MLGQLGEPMKKMVKEAKADEILEKLGPYGAIVLTTTLASEQEERLRQVLSDEEYH